MRRGLRGRAAHRERGGQHSRRRLSRLTELGRWREIFQDHTGKGQALLSGACAGPAILCAVVYCVACGRELPVDARFCVECGAAQGAPEADRNAPSHWETARIVWQDVGLRGQCFEADVTTPSGTYRICDPQREAFSADPRKGGPQRNDRSVVSAHRSLVERLIREGFEPVGVGETWWAERFRRAATLREYETCEIVLRRSRYYADALGAQGHFSRR